MLFDTLSAALAPIDGWGAEHAAAIACTPAGVIASYGAVDHSFRLASIAKLLTAYAVMVAVEERTVSLDDAAGPPGATLRHLLSHASGYGFDAAPSFGADVLARPGARRIYSNRGIEEAAAYLAQAASIPFTDYLREAVLEPLQLNATELRGSPAHGVWSTANDLARFVAELFAPTLISGESLREMTSVQFPGLAGVLPDVGRFDPLDWGLGFERTFGRRGHWAGASLSPETFGHFGGAGTFVWLDPALSLACVCLTDRQFGRWALERWPPFNDAVVTAWRYGRPP